MNKITNNINKLKVPYIKVFLTKFVHSHKIYYIK